MIEKEAYDKAVYWLGKCATPHGFHAAYPGYDAVWARDSMITSLGASLLGEKFKKTFAASIKTLAKHQAKSGQVPNAVDLFSRRKGHVDFKSIDSSLWFVIGNYVYKKRFGSGVFDKKKVNKAINWVSGMDFGENGMPIQLPTSDWQDAFAHRYGATINTQALYYDALKLNGRNAEASRLKKVVNENKDDGLWFGDYYLSWRWKNHNKYKEMGTWFDSLGNLLAIVFDLADTNRAEKILRYVKKKGIAKPYPVKAIYPPILQGSKDWQDYFLDADSRNPYSYLNGGIWTYIGGFYILALIKMKKFNEARVQLRKLAEANMELDGNFSEWLHGKTGKASEGGGQAWNAGMYILASESLKKKKVLL